MCPIKEVFCRETHEKATVAESLFDEVAGGGSPIFFKRDFDTDEIFVKLRLLLKFTVFQRKNIDFPLKFILSIN